MLVYDARFCLGLIFANEPAFVRTWPRSFPYPVELVQNWTLRDGTRVVIHPIRPEDRQIEQDFVHNLSDDSRYFRLFNALRDLSETALTRFTQVNYEREMALIAVISGNDRKTGIGVARYAINPDGTSCEFAIVVADAWQRKRIGSKLMHSLMDALGFTIDASAGDPSLRHAVKNLATRDIPAATAANRETT